MTISVVCPHCESRFQLSPDLIGKSMRCPNADCREVFQVAEEVTAGPPPAIPLPEPEPAAVEVDSFPDLIPVFEGESVAPPQPAAKGLSYKPEPATPIPVYDAEVVPEPAVARAAPSSKPKPPDAIPLPIDPAPILKAAPILPAPKLPPPPPAPLAPREVVWNENAAPPPAPKTEWPKMGASKPIDDIPIRTRARKSSLPKVIFIALVFLLVVVGGAIVGLFLYRGAKAEEELAVEANEQYQKGEFGEARKKFDTLQDRYPDSQNREKYAFFAQLSGVKGSITAVTTRENPAPAIEGLNKFLAEKGESPLAQPTSGYGADIVQGGQLLCLAIAGNAEDRVRAFRGNRTKLTELDAAEKAIADGRALIPALEKYRDKTTLSFDDIRIKYDAVAAEVSKERDRLAVLAPWRTLADDPTDRTIEEFEKKMKAAKLDADAEVRALAAAAKMKLRQLVLFKRERVEADPFPRVYNAVTAFAPRIHETPNPRPGPEGTADAVFAIGRGVLYVLDAHTGQLLWADRVSTDPRTADVPLRFQSADGTADWLIVPTVLDGEAGLTARDTRTGRPLWHQVLPAPVVGRPVRIGSRLLVGLKDDNGTLLQIDTLSGSIFSRGELRQTIGGGLAAFRGTRSAHGFLVVPADANRVFLFEVGKEGDDQRVLPPQPVRVLATEHPEGSLRGEPLLIDPEDRTAPRRIVLTQTDLPTTMKLRSFELPNLAGLSVPQPEEDVGPKAASDAPVSGWSWFPPVSDGERVAVATDSGAFAVFGLNQTGNADQPLFQIPGKTNGVNQNAVSRGLVVSADEDAYWVVMNGQLARLGTAADPTGGFRIVPLSAPHQVGEPIARGQVRPQLNLGFLTVKANDSTTLHTLAFDLTTGDIKWRRQLGAVPVVSPIPQPGGGHLVVDESGGVYRLASQMGSDAVTVEPVSAPLAATTFPAKVAHTADGKTVWVVVGEADREGQKLLVRKLDGGKPAGEFKASIPAPLAGSPAVLGDYLLLPLNNGYVYRLNVDKPQPAQGPVWRGADAKPESPCHLTAAGPIEFLATDGGKSVFRWKWADDQMTAEKAGGPWQSNETITAAAQLMPVGGVTYLMVPDQAGVSAFEVGKPTEEPVRRWRGDKALGIAGGRVTHLSVDGQRVVVAIEGKSLMGIDPTKDAAVWGVADWPSPEAGEVMGMIDTGDSVLVTYQAGPVRQYRIADGGMVGEAERAVGAPLVPVAACPAGIPNRILVSNTDGTLAVVTLIPRR